MKNKLLTFLLSFSFLICILYRDQVIIGSAEGLVLWYRHIVPVLLPFMLITDLMVISNSFHLISSVVGRILRLIPGVSDAGSFAVLTGFMCGYPTGAKTIANLVTQKKISTREGAFLLSFCNNTSPMFITGIVFRNYIPESPLWVPLFFIFMGSQILCGQLYRFYHFSGDKAVMIGCFKEDSPHAKGQSDDIFRQVEQAMTDASSAIVKVGMYMMLFTVMIRILDLALPEIGPAKSVLLASLELTSGISIIGKTLLSQTMKYVLLMGMVSFGGLCAVFQTASMIHGSGMKILPYIAEKLITASVTSLLTYLYLCVTA